MDDPKLRQHFKGHLGAITGVAFNPLDTSNQIATSSIDCSMMVWNYRQRIRCLKFTEHTDGVNSIAWSSNGELILTASSDRSIRIWVPTVQGGSTSYRAHTSNIRSVDFDPKGKRVS